MHHWNHLDISIYQIRMFLEVAERRSFTRAAMALNVEQPTLSKRIALLEQALDIRLLVRSTRPVKLTPEGEVLYRTWKKLDQQFEDSLNEADELRMMMQKTLKVAGADCLNIVSGVSHMRIRMLEEFPELKLDVVYTSYSEWRAELESGEIDLMITLASASMLLPEHFAYEQIAVCDHCICMLRSNPLSKRDHIEFRDLKDQRFLVMHPSQGPTHEMNVMHVCQTFGVTPDVRSYRGSPHGLLSNLQENEVTVCDRFFRDFSNPLLKTFPVRNCYSGLIAVWKKENNNPYIHSFVELLREYSDEL